ncbi:MAG: transposase [bacterium]|nr:transposase [bacterium]
MNVLKQYLVDHGKSREPLVRIMAYCLMGNHYHLISEEIQEGGITKFMHKLGVGYANYFNNKHKRVGSLFQGRFKNVLVETDQQLLYLLVYINVLNPAEFVAPNWKEQGIPNIGKVLQYAESYIWGTHLEYLGKRKSLIIDKGILDEMLPTPEAYLELVCGVLRGKKYEAVAELMLE